MVRERPDLHKAEIFRGNFEKQNISQKCRGACISRRIRREATTLQRASDGLNILTVHRPTIWNPAKEEFTE